MTVKLTKEEMLRRRRIADGLEPLRTDCTIARTDGIDIDAYLATELRRRYLHLLDHAPRELLATETLSGDTDSRKVALDETEGAQIDVPGRARRVFGIRMRGWQRAAEVLPAERLDEVVARQRNPYTAATAWRPVAVFTSGDSTGCTGPILAWPLTGLYPEVEELVAVCDPGEEFYILDEAGVEELIKN